MLMICKKGFGRVIIARLAAIIGAIINMISAITLIIPRAKLSMEFLVFWCACLNIPQNYVEAITKSWLSVES